MNINKEIRCPYCNNDLNGRDKIVRSIVIDDSDYFGIIDGKIINCNIAPSQPSCTELTCIRCGESIEEYIENIIENGVVKRGDFF